MIFFPVSGNNDPSNDNDKEISNEVLRYGSEVIFYWRNPSTDSLLRIVTSRDNWCVNAISLFVMLKKKKLTLLRRRKIEEFLFEGMTTV